MHSSTYKPGYVKLTHPMPVFLTYLMTEVVSSFYTLLDVGKEANGISVDVELARRK